MSGKRKAVLIAGGLVIGLLLALFAMDSSGFTYRAACMVRGGRAQILENGWGAKNAYCYSRFKSEQSGKSCCSDDQCGSGECVLSDRGSDLKSTCKMPDEGGYSVIFDTTGQCSNKVLLPWQQY